MMPSCSRPSRTLRAAKTRCPSGLLDRRCARRLWNAQVGTAGWPSRSNNGMIVWFSPPPGGRVGLSEFARLRTADRRPGIAACAGIHVSPLLPEHFANLIAMERQDLVPEIVDQFEHGERHFGRPEAGDLDGSRTQVRGAIAPARS